jgi:DNA-damage-inducible protein J
MGMSKCVTVQARVEPDLKKEVDAVLGKIGVSPSQVINALYAQIMMQRGVPFELKIPNEETKAAMDDAINRRNLTEWSSLEDLKKFADES